MPDGRLWSAGDAGRDGADAGRAGGDDETELVEFVVDSGARVHVFARRGLCVVGGGEPGWVCGFGGQAFEAGHAAVAGVMLGGAPMETLLGYYVPGARWNVLSERELARVGVQVYRAPNPEEPDSPSMCLRWSWWVPGAGREVGMYMRDGLYWVTARVRVQRS